MDIIMQPTLVQNKIVLILFMFMCMGIINTFAFVEVDVPVTLRQTNPFLTLTVDVVKFLRAITLSKLVLKIRLIL
jgi:hypothetical protein